MATPVKIVARVTCTRDGVTCEVCQPCRGLVQTPTVPVLRLLGLDAGFRFVPHRFPATVSAESITDFREISSGNLEIPHGMAAYSGRGVTQHEM